MGGAHPPLLSKKVVQLMHQLKQFLSFPPVQFGLACVLVSLLWRSGALPVLLHSYWHLAVSTVCVFALAIMSVSVYYRLTTSPCYLVDFCCTKGEENTKVNMETFEHFMRRFRSVEESNLLFQFRVFRKSGVGEEAYAPPRLIEKAQDVDLEDAREETQGLIERAVKRLLLKTGVKPREVDIVVLNSSLFSPAPSLTAFLVNKFKMRSNVKSFNLAGMGCSAGLVSVDLAKDLLRVHRNSYALVVSTENITRNLYFGNNRSMMVSNCLFRCGACALLLSNKGNDRDRAKLQLMHCLRTHTGAENKAFDCVTHKEDDKGELGVLLETSLTEVAGNALRTNIIKLAPSILPLSELLKVLVNLVEKKLLKMAVKSYEPNFKKAIDHFCIHPGGRAVIESIGKGLKLTGYDTEPGRMALNRFGNTSSSGIWYALAYCEAKGKLRKGDKVWQIALGSGFKCNSGVWRVMRDIHPYEGLGSNPWLSCIHRYPTNNNPAYSDSKTKA